MKVSNIMTENVGAAYEFEGVAAADGTDRGSWRVEFRRISPEVSE